MISLAQRLRGWGLGRFGQWLTRRSPRARSVTLDQRRIFILPTRNGLYFLLMVFAIYLGGTNYSNSLILATSFLLASLFLVSILQTYANLAGLTVSAGHCQEGFAGETVMFELNLQRHKRRHYESIHLLWAGMSGPAVNLIDVQQVPVKMHLPVEVRGWYRPPRVRIETRFPLGLLVAWSWVELDMRCLVYPEPCVCELPQKAALSGEQGEQLVREGSDDFFGLRDYVAGDSQRQLAWKHYARTGKLYSKEFAGHSPTERWLAWDLFSGRGVEERLSCLCYWVLNFGERGVLFGLKLPGIEIPPAKGDVHMRRCLRALASHALTEEG